MPEPINYLGLMPQFDFTKDIMGGLQVGDAISQLRAADTQRRQAMALQQQYQADLQAHFANPTPQGAAALVAKYPQQREALTESWKTLTEEQKRGELKAGNMVFSALQNGRTELAAQVMADRIAALKNAGMPTADEERVLELINTNPEQAKGVVGYTLASIDDKFADNYAKFGEESRKTELQPAALRRAKAEASSAEVESVVAPARAQLEMDNIRSQIEDRAGRLSLDTDKLISDTQFNKEELRPKGGQLHEGGRNFNKEAAATTEAADQSATQMLSLAEKLEKLGGGWGAAGGAVTWLQNAFGAESAWNDARREYIRLRNAAAIKSLPPGPSTDKDVDMAMKGFPPESAAASTLSSFLRGMAKLQQREAVYENARAEWVSSVGHLGKARADVEVDGRKVPAGTSFTDFIKQHLDKKAGEQFGSKTVQARSYMRWAQPAGATPAGLGSGTFGIGGKQ